MFSQVSVVIISNNTTATIKKTIASAAKFSSDIIVVFNGNVNGSEVREDVAPATLIETAWLGFGATKNIGNREAKNNWILSLDADEDLDDDLVKSIKNTDLTDEKKVYAIKRLNYFGDRPVHFGAWKNDWVLRLFNRKYVSWDDALVHEKLVLSGSANIQKIKGRIHHFTASNLEAYKEKLGKYAFLMAAKYQAEGRKPHWHTLYLASLFNFTKNYFVRFGWLDKKTGLQIAIAHAQYTFKKYAHLRELHEKETSSFS